MGATYSSHADRCLKRSSTFRNYTQSEPRFRALLTEDGDRMLFHPKRFYRLGEVLAWGPR